jgi:hypothetical protein
MKVRRIDLTVSTELGESNTGVGEFREYSSPLRYAMSFGWLLTAFALAIVLVVVPVIHLITTWLLPIAGVVGFVTIIKTRATITKIQSQCPACNSTVLLRGGRATDQMRESCDDCNRPLIISRTQ